MTSTIDCTINLTDEERFNDIEDVELTESSKASANLKPKISENETVTLSDNDNIEKSIIKEQKENSYLIDKLFEENSLLTTLAKRCLDLENSDGMLRIVNKTLRDAYSNMDEQFKLSRKFKKLLKRTLRLLARDPDHKFSTIKNCCDVLKAHKTEKKADCITLPTNLKGNQIQNYKDREKTVKDVYEKLRDIDDLDESEPEYISDESEHTDIDICLDKRKRTGSNVASVMKTKKNKTTTNIKDSAQTHIPIIDLDDYECDVIRIEDDLCPIYCDKENNNLATKNISNLNEMETQNQIEISIDPLPVFIVDEECVEITGNKLPVLQNNLEVNTNENTQESIKLGRIHQIEYQIGVLKKLIEQLDAQEVTDDTLLSPYVQSEKFKKEMVSLYRELCTLTGDEPVKYKEVRLKALKGHPSGPMKNLERFLNDNIRSNGEPIFPDFCDVVTCVEDANLKENLGWSKGRITQEASALFLYCGRALQKRRQRREWRDLRQCLKHEDFEHDPADYDPELRAKLEKNRQISKKKESEVFERFSNMQYLSVHESGSMSSQKTNTREEIHKESTNKESINIEIHQESTNKESINTETHKEIKTIDNQNQPSQPIESSFENQDCNIPPNKISPNKINTEKVNIDEIGDKYRSVIIKREPGESTITLLNSFGDNYTTTVIDIEDPFVVIEVSSDSDSGDDMC